MNMHSKKYLILMGIVIFIVLFVFVSINSPLTYKVFAEIVDRPIFKHNSKGISLVSAYTSEPEYLEQVLIKAYENNIHITIFVPSKWAANNQKLIAEMIEIGHEISILGPDLENFDYSLDIKELILEFEKYSGKKTALFMPFYGEYDSRLCAKLKQLNISLILWSKDSRAFAGIENEFATKLISLTKNGDIIYIAINDSFYNSIEAISAELTKSDRKTITVGNALKH